jgi:hypothetical protein
VASLVPPSEGRLWVGKITPGWGTNRRHKEILSRAQQRLFINPRPTGHRLLQVSPDFLYLDVTCPEAVRAEEGELYAPFVCPKGTFSTINEFTIDVRKRQTF